MFQNAREELNYEGKYTYCYCTKSSHFSFVLDEVLKNDVHIEASSAFDLPLIENLYSNKKITKEKIIVCNGFKRPEYSTNIIQLINKGFKNLIPVLDNINEFNSYDKAIKNCFKIGIRMATEEIPNYNFYTSRLGIDPKRIVDYYKSKLANHPRAELTMLHFFINTGIRDHVYYWNELAKCLKIFAELKNICPSLDTLNIGGGLPFKSSLDFNYDYQGFIRAILKEVKTTCEEYGIREPNIMTEFGTFTVAEASANIFTVLNEKNQNDKESWYMINNSFMTTLPDTWGIGQRFIILPINKWFNEYKAAFLGGLTCDSMDFYNAEIHNNKLFMPKLDKTEPLHIGFFNTGAYQDALAGHGGIKHCLVPSPKQIILKLDQNNNLTSSVFSEEQKPEDMLKILGYQTD
jgi:arginine decarboxylase